MRAEQRQTSSPGRPRGAADSRDRLLAAALAAFTRVGYEAAGLRAIADEAGCDVSMVAHHFGSKAGLWRAVVECVGQRHDLWLRDVIGLVNSKSPVADRLGALADSMIDGLVDVPGYVSFVNRALAEPGERRDALVERVIRPGVETCTPLWREAMAAGVLRALDPTVLHIGLFGACTMLLMMTDVCAELGGRALDVGDLKAELRTLMLSGHVGRTPG